MQSGLNRFEVNVLTRAKLELQEVSEYYELIVDGLGTKFYLDFMNHAETLHNFPFFENKYDKIHTFPLKIFPYTIHFTIDEDKKLVSIHAVTCDYQNPKTTRIKI